MAKFQPGKSGNKLGRPAGVKSRAASLRQKFIDDFEGVADAVLLAAKNGDIQAARLCLDRCLPPLRGVDAPVKIEISKNLPLIEQAKEVLAAAVAGKVSISQASQLANTLAALSEKTEILERLATIEAALNIQAGK